MTVSTQQMFDWIIACQETFDDVIDNLAAAGIKVQPDQHHIVSQWLDVDYPASATLLQRLADLRERLSDAQPV